MDWLANHDVIVNCGSKYIELKCIDGEILRVDSSELNTPLVMITSIRAQKFMRKGYEAYLALFLNTRESDLKIESVPIVREYPDVFLEELPGLPPVREVEFGIKLVPGRTPISIALYRKALAELKELKAQLPSFLPWELRARPTFLQEICTAQINDSDLQVKRAQCETGVESDFWIGSSDCLMFWDKVCAPKDDELIWKILQEAHDSRLSVHPRSTKMIAMDFVTGLSLTQKKKDVVWVVVDRLAKPTHFISVRTDYSLDELADLYISEIVKLHGIPLSIISDKDLRFTLRF
ncbi:uncharacterized protein LOC128285422 [Gossypium arboreum]|uniref:uncharacterized protein LOC128285422 n=1 Tax=Gossypium arboreum TaxID=29729 RepID=UPI0022F17B63|nr:uncharacterized protein LOC128285422 [Gossypium arboreum]